MSRLVVFESDHPASRFWAAKWLREYDVPYAEEDGRLTVAEDPLHREAMMLADRLAESYTDVCAEAARQGIEIKPYKPLERHVIFVAMVAALRDTESETEERYAAVLHECVWAQGLPNANHRSALTLVTDMMADAGHDLPNPTVVRHAGEAFAEASKPHIREKEFTAAPLELKVLHKAAATRFVRTILPANRGS